MGQDKKVVSKPSYPPQSAARHMTANVPIVLPQATIADIERLLLEKVKEFDTINYIYVVDTEKKLLGVISIREYFSYPKTERAVSIMEKKIKTVRRHTDQERVAIIALKNSLKAVPVVAKDKRFLGVVPSDAILNVLNQESVEDILRSAGIATAQNNPFSFMKEGVRAHVLRRLPWLIVGLFGGMLAVLIIQSFQEVLKTELLLAAFIPVLIYLTDAVGTQTQTVFIRSLLVDSMLSVKSYIVRELQIGFSLALFLGIFIFLISALVFNAPLVGVVVALSLIAAVLLASIVAILLPYTFTKLGFDPAIASGPFATVIRDVTSLLIYFGIAHAIFAFF